MNFSSALEFVYKFKDLERDRVIKHKISLDHFSSFLEKIGSPHLKINKPILIAGTKGKGSTAHILSSILQEVGKVGLYTSPHLVDVRERIKINNELIPEEVFANIVEEIKPYVTDRISTFELLTAIAFIYFLRENVDFSILEIGIGGRLDATNVVKPFLCIITPISFDHTDILGNDLISIASEKCGIIKGNHKMVCAPQEQEIMALIKNICKERNVDLTVIGEDVFCENVEVTNKGSKFSLLGEKFFLPLLGRHQIINTLSAIVSAKICGVEIGLIKKGVEKVRYCGRLQILQEKPLIIVDGAHNVASAWVLRRAIVELFDYKRLFLVFGVLNDKDKRGIIEVLAPITKIAFVTRLDTTRTAEPKELKSIFDEFSIPCKIIENPTNAILNAINMAKKDDLVLATGSLYLVGHILKENLFLKNHM